MVNRITINCYDAEGVDVRTREAAYAPAAALLEQGDADFLASLEEQLLALLNGMKDSVTEKSGCILLHADRQTARIHADTSRWYSSDPKSVFSQEETLADAWTELQTRDLYEYVCRWNVAERSRRKKEAVGGGFTPFGIEEVRLIEKLRRVKGYRNVLCKPFFARHSSDSALDYVVEHVEEQHSILTVRDDSYAVIELQMPESSGRGMIFRKNRWCRDVLMLIADTGKTFPDECPKEILEQILEFANRNQDADTLLIVGEGRMAETLTTYLTWEQF